MPLTIKMMPEEGGQLVLDSDYYNPDLTYTPGSMISVKVLPQKAYQFTGWKGDIPSEKKSDMPLRIKVTDEKQEIVATFQENAEHTDDLVFDSNFENGNGILRYYDRAARQLVIEPEQINLANNIWWHFKIHNITPGEFLRLDLGHWDIAGDCQPVYSYDGINWQRMTGVKSPFIQRFTSSTVEIARNIPYLYSRSITLAEELAGSLVKPQTLAISEGGRLIMTLRLTDPQVADDQKRIIWVMARLHAFESHSSYYAEGLAKWLSAGSSEALDILKRFIFYVTPVMDVDTVVLGGSGKEQLTWDKKRVDFNRQWSTHSHWAAIRSAKHLLEELHKNSDIAAFIDLHSPWYPETPHWNPPEEFETQVRQFAEVYSRSLDHTNTGAQWGHRIIVHRGIGQDTEPTMDPNLQNSTFYANTHLFPEKDGRLCFVNEIPHWTDGYGNCITLDNLYAYGEAMGRALGKYLG